MMLTIAKQKLEKIFLEVLIREAPRARSRLMIEQTKLSTIMNRYSRKEIDSEKFTELCNKALMSVKVIMEKLFVEEAKDKQMEKRQRINSGFNELTVLVISIAQEGLEQEPISRESIRREEAPPRAKSFWDKFRRK